MAIEQINWRHELTTLAFITRGGNWLFLLLSRLGEPLMFLSVLYVVAETVLPSLFRTPLWTSISGASLIILNIAPEVILPGCFVQARQSPEQQRWMYLTMGWVFIILTFITLASFIWQFSVLIVSFILFFRCAAGVLYSLLVRMSPQTETVSMRDYHQQIETLSVSVAQMHELVQSVQVQVQEASHEQVNQLEQTVIAQVESIVVNRVQPLLHASTSADREDLRALAEQVQEVSMTVHAIQTTFTEVRTVQSRKESIRLVQSPAKVVQSEQANEPLETRVKDFITEQREQGHDPTLSEIMNRCKCSKGSAIRYRRELPVFAETEHLPAIQATH